MSRLIVDSMGEVAFYTKPGPNHQRGKKWTGDADEKNILKISEVVGSYVDPFSGSEFAHRLDDGFASVDRRVRPNLLLVSVLSH
jgi:hypothetical protein